MKKIILIASLLICGLTQAQVSVFGDGNEINDGQIITVNELGSSTQLDLVFSNTSTESVTIRMKVKSITNNVDAGSNNSLQLCVQPQCFNNINVDTTIPTVGVGVTIDAGSHTNGVDNHFKNSHPGDDTSMPVSYEFGVITVDGDGNETSEIMSFTYTYDATAASTTDFAALQNAGISLKSTIITNSIEIDAQQGASMELYNINGQLIKTVVIATGNQAIDLSSLNTAVYIARFTTEDNKTAQIRVVKQ
ncbi:MAG: hypothetical protein BM557_02355 [Flavobacterium sp. MedPE-SWcel]|uniref:T9SS type A sorting domain-containing protein n=1 Tax=uncultured Flavobacterium sp. TaxID=165435 RepID=UPI0009213DF2|nr:T9SS type A sorting domain-containing protein [uncultured Flavobacterium sp.]OIQ21659.1 MAG: hypothetical protein BM557_02355 [Flavobacterium sp. MedPE-SWcel]